MHAGINLVAPQPTVVAAILVGNAHAFGAEARGATLLPRTAVTRVSIKGGKVTGIDTDRDSYRKPVVVDVAGAFG
jgi:glycine/D-amino acid oxidase-like deaminating enzyme